MRVAQRAERPQLAARSGAAPTSNDEPLPIGGEPTRSSVFHSATCVGNMSCRAALSPPRADHADLVAVVDDRRAAQQVEQVVAEQVALAAARPPRCPRRACDGSAARRGPCRGCRGRSAASAPTPFGCGSSRRPRAATRSPSRPTARARSRRRASWNGKSSTFGRPAVAHERATARRRRCRATSPKIWKSVHARRLRRGLDPRHPEPEERGVDVPRRVDAEAVELVLPRPSRA